MEYLSKLEESALAKFDQGDFNGAISDLSKVRYKAFYYSMCPNVSSTGHIQSP